LFECLRNNTAPINWLWSAIYQREDYRRL